MSPNSRVLVSAPLGTGNLPFDATAAPAPGAGDVCVETCVAVVDALDAVRCRGEDPRSSFPLVPGRVALGKIAAVGADVAHAVGGYVLVPELLPCGECDACRRARAPLCRRLRALGLGGAQRATDSAVAQPVGGMARFTTVPARYLLPLGAELADFAKPDRLPVAVAAAWAAPLYQALVMGGVATGDVAAIVGHGERAQTLRLLLEQKGVRVLEDADVAELDAQASQRELPRLAWKIFLLQTDSASLERLAQLIGPAATIVVALENPQAGVACDLGWLAQRDAQVRTSTSAHPDLYPEVLAMVLNGFAPPVLRQFPFAQAQAAIDHAAQHGPAIVVF